MLQRSPLLSIISIIVLLCVGCVAKGDYLQKEAEADQLSREMAAKAAESAALRDQISRGNADREKLTAERDDIKARLQAKTNEFSQTSAETTRALEEMNHTLEELKTRNLELEGDKQMLLESIALLRKAREDLTNKNTALQENVALLEGEKKMLGKDAALLEAERQALQESLTLLKKTREEAVQTVSKTYEDLLQAMKGEVEQGQIAITELQGKLTMDVVDKILFDSGQAEVKQQGLVVLQRVVAVLKTLTDKTIRVEGHTDNVRIGGVLGKRFPTNWELSAARAINVARYLQREGIDPTLLSAAAFGEYQPVADNETPEGRAKNRRIAIILLPKE
jgi:chemotaxis protein MotB